jgi:hypothetical protein
VPVDAWAAAPVAAPSVAPIRPISVSQKTSSKKKAGTGSKQGGKKYKSTLEMVESDAM